MLQFVLMALIVVAAVAGPRWPAAAGASLGVVGVALAVAGLVLGVASGRALGAGLTAFPHPTSSGELIEHGPYRFVRHPIYSAGILVFAGVSLLLSPAALALTGVLAVVWALKSAVEERFLRATYPAYAAYEERVRYRLAPFVY